MQQLSNWLADQLSFLGPVPVLQVLAATAGFLLVALAVDLVASWMLRRALLPDHPSCSTTDVSLARWMAFVRSHWLRMPPGLLAIHLLHKALRAKE